MLSGEIINYNKKILKYNGKILILCKKCLSLPSLHTNSEQHKSFLCKMKHPEGGGLGIGEQTRKWQTIIPLLHVQFRQGSPVLTKSPAL